VALRDDEFRTFLRNSCPCCALVETGPNVDWGCNLFDQSIMTIVVIEVRDEEGGGRFLQNELSSWTRFKRNAKRS
jgi:hypothetical protein